MTRQTSAKESERLSTEVKALMSVDKSCETAKFERQTRMVLCQLGA